ncbi:MAG: hypothetical protein IT254_01530 [Chitinophagaceae bacterium]|nr:hypothetical protein [Bacteroidota bacterium]MCC6256981.1 hypothetical protein [Chitinophagaceae bacterium]MCW5916342.1 hypothetical protein [Ferruginibacter sp.]
MKKLIFSLLAFGATYAYGQDNTFLPTSTAIVSQQDPPKKQGDDWMMFTRGIGVSFQNFDGLNDRLKGFSQYKELRDHAFTLSLGTLNQYKNFISGFEVTGGSSMSGHRDKKSSTTRFLGAAVDFGYDVIPSKKIVLYPYLGIGGESYWAKFFKDNSGVDFDDVAGSPAIQNAIRPVSFNNGWFGWRGGIGVGIRNSSGNSLAMLKAGYTGSFKDRAWKSSDNQTLNGAPKDGLNRWFVSIVLGDLKGKANKMK